jgi:1-deoxy-D-xylulose-5-phosphate synthase
MSSYSVDMSEEALARANERVRAIESPEDVRALRSEEIEGLCDDLRRVLIDRTERNGGHLASNLGVVELTVAIHRTFDAPRDHIIFDVGHQCYVHKLLTGRARAFETLRRPDGISGFPRREESAYDAFGTGHASTSLSAGLGFAASTRLISSMIAPPTCPGTRIQVRASCATDDLAKAPPMSFSHLT